MSVFRSAFAPIKEHQRTFIVFNVAFYGVMILTMLVTALVPHAQEAAIASAHQQLDLPALAMVGAAYDSGNILWAAGITLLVNFLVGALLTTTVPSLFIPFFGIAFTLYRVIQWGVTFSPLDGNWGAFLPHFLTLIIEGQAYLVAAFAVWLHWCKVIRPSRFNLSTRWAGYTSGVKDTIRLYPLVLALLVIGALYEAIELIHIVPHFM